MTNMYDYLDWRGDLDFQQSPFNEVDNLIFAWLSYVDLEEVMADSPDGLTIKQASERFFKTHEPVTHVDAATFNNVSIISTQLLEKLAPTRRFGGLTLLHYRSRMDEERVEQFAAVTLLINEREAYVAFRGTDSSFVGWKEDFSMSFMPAVPSQVDALKYLESVAGGLPPTLYVGGHSKGGNLAVYAAANASPEIQSRIKKIYNNDGPGFSNALLSSDGYGRISDRVKTILPRSSIVGLFFEHEENYTVVNSTNIGLLQHNALNWEVKGPGFVELPTLSAGSAFFDRTARDWIAGLSETELQAFVNALFSILEQTGTHSFEDLSREKMRSALSVARSFGGLDAQARKILMDVIGKLAAASAENLRARIAEHGPRWRKTQPDALTDGGEGEVSEPEDE